MVLEKAQNLPQAFFPVVRGGAAAEVDGVHRPALQQREKGLDVGQQSPLVAVHQLLLAGQGVEVAVVALAFAEGDVDIDTENTSQANPSDPAQKARQVILNSLLYDSFSRMARYYSRSGRLLSGKKRWYNNLIA